MPYVNGQFINKSQLEGGQQAPSTGMEQGIPGTDMGATEAPIGGSMSQLQKLLGLYALSKGNATGAWSILQPKSTETAEQRNRKSALKPAYNAVQKALTEKYENTGPIAQPEILSIKHLGGLGARQSLIKQNQTFALLKQNVVRALQGARMSDQDIKLAGEYIPSVGDTPETIHTKLEGLDGFISSLMEIPQKPSLDTFNEE
jgi:hypothetical protein